MLGPKGLKEEITQVYLNRILPGGALAAFSNCFKFVVVSMKSSATCAVIAFCNLLFNSSSFLSIF